MQDWLYFLRDWSPLHWFASWFVIDLVTFRCYRGKVISTIWLDHLYYNWINLHLSVSCHATWNVLRWSINLQHRVCPYAVSVQCNLQYSYISNFEIFRRCCATCFEVFSTSYIRLRCNESHHRLSLGMSRMVQIYGASLGAPHLIDTPNSSQGRSFLRRHWQHVKSDSSDQPLDA